MIQVVFLIFWAFLRERGQFPRGYPYGRRLGLNPFDLNHFNVLSEMYKHFRWHKLLRLKHCSEKVLFDPKLQCCTSGHLFILCLQMMCMKERARSPWKKPRFHRIFWATKCFAHICLLSESDFQGNFFIQNRAFVISIHIIKCIRTKMNFFQVNTFLRKLYWWWLLDT